MAKHTINRQQLLVEFISIVFAVLLALLLNAWWQGVTTGRTLDKVKKSIASEIKKNHASVLESWHYRRELITELYEDRHVITVMPLAGFPIDVNDDRALEEFLQQTVPFGQNFTTNDIRIKRLNEQRVLILDELTMKLAVMNDSLYLFGASNLKLRSADVSNRSWEISQATGVLAQMDLELVDALNKVYTLNNHYLATSDKAIDMIYRGERGIVSVLEDMAHFESQIMQAHSVLLNLLYTMQ